MFECMYKEETEIKVLKSLNAQGIKHILPVLCLSYQWYIILPMIYYLYQTKA